MIKEKRSKEKFTHRKRGRAIIGFLLALLLAVPVNVFGQSLKTTTNLKLRSGPSMSTEIQEIIPKGTEVDILHTTGNWGRTSYGQGGYVGLKYLEPTGNSDMSRVTTNLRLRSGPSTNYSILGILPKGTAVPVFETQGNWVKTVWQGKIGWLGVKFTEAITDLPDREVVSRVNLRKGPGTSYEIIKKLQPGTVITVIGQSGSWIQTAHDGDIGWLSQSYTKPLEEMDPRFTTASTALRRGPGDSHGVLTTVPAESLLPVAKESKGWIFTSWEGLNGWVSIGDTVRLEDTNRGLTTYGVNFRRGPGTNHSVIEMIPKGVNLPILSLSGDWVFSWYNGNSGWLHRNYIQPLGTSQRPASPPQSLLNYSNTKQNWSHAYPQNGNYGYPEFGGHYRYDDDKVYLTFDYGWENGYTPSFLDTLNEKGVKSIMYVTGYYMRSRPDLVQRMKSEGHIVANHSDTHPDTVALMDESMQEVYNDLLRWESEYRKIFGMDPDVWYYRAPSGIFSQRTMALLHWMGYQTEFWDAAYRDWDVDNQPSEEEAMKLLMKDTKPGSIVLLHTVSSTNEKILGQYIDAIRAKGWEIGDPNDLGND